MGGIMRKSYIAVMVLAMVGLVLPAIGGVSSVGASPAKGAPIKIMTWFANGTTGGNYPGTYQIVKAAATVQNRAGGINGHRIIALSCNTQDDPNVAETCARTAVSDHVVAIVGCYDRFDANSFPVLQAAHIPAIGCGVVTATDTSSPVSFPVLSGAQSIYVADGYLAAKTGCKHLSIAAIAVAAVAPLTAFIEDGWESQGKTAAPITQIPVASPDITAAVSSATTGADCVSFVAPGTTVLQFMTTAAQLGASFKVVSVPSQVTPQVIAQVGSALNGAVMAGWFAPLSAPGWSAFKAAAKVAGTTFDETQQIYQGSWVAFQAFTAVAKQLPKISGPALIKKMNATAQLSIPIAKGVAVPVQWAHKFVASMPRLFSRSVFFSVVENGTYVEIPPFGAQDMTKYFPAS
jgi:ABC-type branched-subunit amino acid transport system substrate-binding protein